MTPDQIRDAAMRSLIQTDDGRACLHSSYAKKHPLSRAVPQGEPTISAMAQSIRELGEMLTVAERYHDFNGRLVEVERLADLVGQRLSVLRGLVRQEWAGAMGIPPAGLCVCPVSAPDEFGNRDRLDDPACSVHGEGDAA